jgi:hypothetical protein
VVAPVVEPPVAAPVVAPPVVALPVVAPPLPFPPVPLGRGSVQAVRIAAKRRTAESFVVIA